MRKPNSNSVLKTMPDKRQEAIADYARDHSLEDTAKWLRDDGIQTSTGALSEFLSWYSLSHQLRQNESTVEQLLANMASTGKYSTEQLEQAGQFFFTALAIEKKDSLTWKRIQDAKLKLGVLELSREKFEVETCDRFLKWFEDRKMRDIAESKLSQADKIAAMRKEGFKDVDALIQSGKLKIPKS